MNLHRTCLVCLLPMLAACSDLQLIRDPTPQASQEKDTLVVDGRHGVHGWLADSKALRGKSVRLLPAMLEAREQAFRANPDLDNRMRLVMVLLVEQEAVQDEKRARELLKQLRPLPASPDDREFIKLLLQFLDARQDDERKQSVLWKQITRQNKRIDELEQQLKALTNIEQNIQQREPPAVNADVKE